jgi:putative MATE family efflux protein
VTKDMTKGNPSEILFCFAMPMVLGNIFQQFYIIIDSVVVGNLVSSKALAEVGASYPITFVFISIATGASIGCSIVISQMFGAKYIGKMKTAINTSLISIIVFSFILMLIGLFSSRVILSLLKTPIDIFENANMFIQIYFKGVVFLFIYNVTTAAFNALGDSKTPLCFLIFSSILNVVLDLLFVIKFKMGISGAAYATLIAQCISAISSLAYLLKKVKTIKTNEEYKLFDLISLKNMCRIAIPSIIQQSIISVGNLFVQALVNIYGWTTIAGYAAATRIDSITIMPMVNLSSAVSTFTAQNVGARENERIKSGYKSALVMIGIFCTCVTFLLFVFGSKLIGMFVDPNANQIVVNTGVEYLRVVSIFYFFMGLMVTTNGVLRGCGDVKVFVFSSLTNLGTRIIFAYTLAFVIGQKAIWWAIPIGWIVASTISVIRYKSGKWKGKAVV